MAVGASIKFLMEVKNIVRDLALDLLSSDPANGRVAKEAAGEEDVLIQGNDPFGQEFFELERRAIFRNQDDRSIHSLCGEPCVSSEYRPFLPARQLDQFVKILTRIVEGVVAEQPQLFRQLPKIRINNELHLRLSSVVSSP